MNEGNRMNIKFLGGAETVTGSKYLLRSGKEQILIDCGLFQGFKPLRLKNWAPFPVHPTEIDAVVLTHAHIDHSGYLPLLVKQGFRGKVYCTSATKDLCGLLLPDSGYLQEEEAKYLKKHGRSKHADPKPLYTQKEAEESLRYLEAMPWDEPFSVGKNFKVQLHYAGHILGAAHVAVEADQKKIIFSGDLGRPEDPLMLMPTSIESADYVVVESTYGDRLHPTVNPSDELKTIINRTLGRGGVVIMPAFAVGRAQLILYHLHQLIQSKKIPTVPVFLNSPMATNANEIFMNHLNDHRLGKEEIKAVFGMATQVRDAEESKALNNRKDPMIVLAASGMATGGRVLHHLKAFIGDAKNSVIFTGFQAGGTRGDILVRGTDKIKIHGEYWPVKAEIIQLESLSAHADYSEALDWLKHLKKPPKKTFITHGELPAADSFRRRIEDTLHWDCVIPEYLEEFHLD